MFDPAMLITYTLACLVFSIVPGPSVTVVLANSVANGTRAGMWTILGTEISMFTMVVVVAVGLQAVMQVVGEAFFVIKLVGAAYLFWLGWKMFTARGGIDLKHQKDSKAVWLYIMQGALVNWSNPKTLLFLGAFLPQFVRLDQPVFAQIMVLGLIVMAVATITDAIYAILAGTARQMLTATRVKFLNRISGAVLMVGGIWLALLRKA